MNMSILDLLFPQRCLGCRAILSESGVCFCGTCEESLVRLEPPYCPRCGEPESPGICFFCREFPPLFEKVNAPYLLGGALAEALHHFKYEDNAHLSKPLIRFVQKDVRQALDWCSVIVPIPLHPLRLRERGYDQASLLAQELAKFGKPLRLRGLSRIMHTSPQVGKNRPQRAANVKGAFVAVQSCVKDQRVLLVDDVLTTGATAAEATKALCQAGARAVQVMAIARAF